MVLVYPSGDEIRPGDLLGPECWSKGHASRVVVVIPTGQAVPEYDPAAWAYLERGVVVEDTNASGTFVVHYPEIDEDF